MTTLLNTPAYGIAPGWEKLTNVFEASVGSSLVSNGHRMITAGDDVVRRALNLPSGHKGVDFVSVDRSGNVRLTEVKDGNNWSGGIAQLEEVHTELVNQNLSNAVTDLRLAIPTTVNPQTTNNNFYFQNGFLYKSDGQYLINSSPVRLMHTESIF